MDMDGCGGIGCGCGIAALVLVIVMVVSIGFFVKSVLPGAIADGILAERGPSNTITTEQLEFALNIMDTLTQEKVKNIFGTIEEKKLTNSRDIMNLIQKELNLTNLSEADKAKILKDFDYESFKDLAREYKDNEGVIWAGFDLIKGFAKDILTELKNKQGIATNQP